MHTLDADAARQTLGAGEPEGTKTAWPRRAAGRGSQKAASMLLPDPPGSGALRAQLAALWSMAERLRPAVFACGFGHMLEGQFGVFLGGWGLGEGATGPET